MNHAGVGSRNLLVIGHPGHELRVYGWIVRTSPLVCILTDASGNDCVPRLAESLALLQTLEAKIGPICGEVTDRQMYAHVLGCNYRFFEDLCERLADVIIATGADVVASDAVEGYNPTHDLCEALTRNAVALANRAQCRRVQHYTFPLMGDPRPQAQSSWLEIELSVRCFQQKLRTARDYACKGGGSLQKELEDTLHEFGEQAFAREYLFMATGSDNLPERLFQSAKPYYESYGDAQVAAGRYSSIIRFREHVAPLMRHLDALASAPLQNHLGRSDARPYH